MKKDICLVTDWYPDRDNPFKGVFFKEQAFALEEGFNFLVVRYREHVKKKIGSKYKVHLINTERNTCEYSLDIYVPIICYLFDFLENLWVKHVTKNTIDGIGKYVSKAKQKFIRKSLVSAFEKKICKEVDAFYCVDAQTEAFNVQCLADYYHKPYIVGEHAPVPWPGSQITDINKAAIEKANMFFAISNDKIRQLMLQNIRLPKIVYLGNMIDETKLKINVFNSSHIKTFIIIAANSFYKNYDLFISVMERLTEITEKPFRVLVAGYGANKGYSKNVEALENRIHASKFSERAELIRSVPHDEIGELLGRADAFVMTSIQEGQPVSALEAACCGLPIFSTRCGGVEDYVNEKMGRLYSITDCEGMAQGLKDYLEGKSTFDSTYIREQVVSKFGKKAFVKNFCNAFLKVSLEDK